MDDPDLLYEDLFEDLEDGKAIIKTSLHEMEDRIKSLSSEAEELRLQVRNLQDQNEGLSKQNEVLIRNISCLFKTAQMEISRKDKQIKRLQEESQNLNAFSSGSPVAADRDTSYLTVVASQANREGKRMETCSASGGIGKQGLHAGKHDEYATMSSRGGCKDKMRDPLGGMCKQAHDGDYAAMPTSKDSKGRTGEKVLASNGAWKQNNHGGAHCDHVSLALQADCKGVMGETPLASAGMRRAHYGSGHQDYDPGASEASHNRRMQEIPSTSGCTVKQSCHERKHCDDAIETLQANHNGTSGESPLAFDGKGKTDHDGKSAYLKLQGDNKGKLKETPVHSGGTEKLRDRDDKHGDRTAMATRSEYKSSEQTRSTPNGMENGDHQRGDRRDHVEKRRSSGEGGELQDEMGKRRRREEYVGAGKEYHRRRGDERHPLDAKRGEGAIDAYRSSDAHKAWQSLSSAQAPKMLSL